MSKPFFGGVPTAGDVKKLLEAFPDPEVGEVIPYARVAEIIKVDSASNRFRTVTTAWRRAVLRTQNFRMEAVSGRGFRRLPEIERSRGNRIGWRRDQGRAAQKTRDLALTDTKEFDSRELQSHDHARRVMQAHVEYTATAVREIAPPKPIPQLPRRSPPSP